jgi:hypothetical protein
MHRRLARPYGSSVPATRLFSLLFALVLIWMLYERMRDPNTWVWLANANDDAPALPAPAEPAAPETIVPGPNDLDADELAEFRNQTPLIADRAPLKAREMPMYWQLMAWSRTQPFRDLEQRAKPEPAFVQVWEQPQKHRGEPIRLRLHIVRVLHWEADAGNPLGVKDIYEAYGWTDESKSFPYCVVFPELPPGLRVGKDAHGEVVFVGYLLKIMAFEGFDAKRGAPLLIGRVRSVATAAPKPLSSDPWMIVILIGVGVVALAAIYGWTVYGAHRRPPPSPLPPDLSELGPITGAAPMAGDSGFPSPIGVSIDTAASGRENPFPPVTLEPPKDAS